jgi:hypothetical protein
MLVKPAPGLKVRDPITKQHLPVEGALVPATAYWLRRLNDADVVEVIHVDRADELPAKGEED